jgi:mRNA-degrading endonuclease toxin of MazEF toxin-antitoxin module
VASCTTAEIKPYPFVVSIKKEKSDLPKDCSINLSAILTISKSRLGIKCGQLTVEKWVRWTPQSNSAWGWMKD